MMIWIILLIIAVVLLAVAISFLEDNKPTIASIICVVASIVVLASGLYITPVYDVWQQGLSGEAALAKAEQTKLIMVETARAERDSASLRADAIKIMGAAAKEFPEYRQQEFMQAFGEALREGNISQIIYVPTEANLPVLEAGKR